MTGEPIANGYRYALYRRPGGVVEIVRLADRWGVLLTGADAWDAECALEGCEPPEFDALAETYAPRMAPPLGRPAG